MLDNTRISNNNHKNSPAKTEKSNLLSLFHKRPLHAAQHYAHIIGWGMKVPDNVVTNLDLESIVDTTDEWIRTRTGIKERHIASERDSATSLGVEAARAAISRANILPSEIDLIIVATSTPEDIYPSTACKIQNLLGANKAGAFDLRSACSGFVYGLITATQCIQSGSMQTILVIGSEVNSRILDWSDRNTCILFGDGAGAVVVQGQSEPGGVLSSEIGSDGSGADLLGIPTVGFSTIPDGYQLHKLHMDGSAVFRWTTHIIQKSVRETVAKAGLTLEEITLIVPHQANQRIIAAAARSLNVSEDLWYSNVALYGNTSAASIPIALCEAEHDKRFKPNDNIVIIGYGGGLSWATMVIHWDAGAKKIPGRISRKLASQRRDAEYIAAFIRAFVLRYYRRLEAWFIYFLNR